MIIKNLSLKDIVAISSLTGFVLFIGVVIWKVLYRPEEPFTTNGSPFSLPGNQLFIVMLTTQSIIAVTSTLTYLKGNSNEKRLVNLHIDLNSRLSQLLEERGKAEHSRGMQDARKEEDARLEQKDINLT